MRRFKSTSLLLFLLASTQVFAHVSPAIGISAKSLSTSIPQSLKWSDVKKATIVVFMSSRCPCSMAHEAELKALVEKFKKPDFQFVVVHSNVDEPEAEARAHFEHSGLSGLVWQDDGARLADAFGALKTPHVFVVEPSGKTIYAGGVDSCRTEKCTKDHFLLEALQAIAAGAKIDFREQRALGCVIRRKGV